MPNNAIATRSRAYCLVGKLLAWCKPGLCKLVLVVLFLACCTGSGSATKSQTDPDNLCDNAAISASRTSGVPLNVLQAISRAETGRPKQSGLQPWPWTVNMEGTGRWFETLDEARAYVFFHFKNGARSFDVGCFQINYKWHGAAFRSIDDMFDPALNAQYAAKFLMDLYQEFGNWPDAAGAYHSRTPEFARKYSTRFDRIKAGLPDGTKLALVYQKGSDSGRGRDGRKLTAISGPRPLTLGGTLALGSLVPIDRYPEGNARPIAVLK